MLAIKRPTPTTVLYTVSTRAQPGTVPGHIANYLVLLLRVLAGLAVLLVLADELQSIAAVSLLPRGFLTHRLDEALSQAITALQPGDLGGESGIGYALWKGIATPRLVRLVLCAAVTWIVSRRGYTEESLLVMRGLGVQTATSSPSYFWAASTRFIPTSSIQDIFLHEAFKGFEVRFYLGIVVEGEEGLVVVFPNILPRRDVLEQVWRGAKACLYEPKT